MKACFIFLITFLIVSKWESQVLGEKSVFAFVSGYRNTGFDNNLFTDVELGANLWSEKRISLEVSVGYLGSRLRDQRVVFNENDIELEQSIQSNIRSVRFAAGINLRLSSRENYWITSFVKLNYVPNARFTSRLFEIRNINNVALKETLQASSSHKFINVGLGIEGFLDDKESWIGSLSLVYTDSRRRIDFPSAEGIGLRYLGRFTL